jgi:beta-aspartyl-peptidase (threonine type)
MADDARAGCRRAVEAGLAVLGGGGSAMDAVFAAVRVLEDEPTFNAGLGSALTRDRTVECDAAIMDGTTRRIGAVAAMRDAGQAIAIARAVLDDGEHVLLCGEGAWAFARERGFRPVDGLVTARSERRWEAAHARRQSAGSGGTVGACAVDARGQVAAATSTGGITYKRPGRIGDTPLAGCGTYADGEGGAASATGIGEAIIRGTMTRVCVDAMRAGASATRAAWASVDELARVTGGTAGIIACDARGGLGAALSTATLSFGAGRLADGVPHILVGVELERGADLDLLIRSS